METVIRDGCLQVRNLSLSPHSSNALRFILIYNRYILVLR